MGRGLSFAQPPDAFLSSNVHAWKSNNGPGTRRTVLVYTQGRTGRYIEGFEHGQPLADAERA
jgi:hypothetical protein